MTVRVLKGVVLVDSEECCEVRIYPDDDGVLIEVEMWDLAKLGDKEGRETRVRTHSCASRRSSYARDVSRRHV